MRYWLIGLGTALLTLFLTLTASAQSSLVLSKVQVAIWPEYDKPEVLVIYRMSLSTSASLPATINIRIPQAAGNPNAVAMQDVDGSLVTLTYTSKPDGEWNILTFNTTSPDFQIEYYDPGLTKNGITRTFEYRWAGDYLVNSMSIQVQQPVGVTSMNLTPSMGTGRQQQDGLTYYDTTVGEVKAGTGFTIRVAYDKKDNNLSFRSSQPVQPASPISDATPGRQTFQEILPWILGGLGLLLILGGALWYWQSSRERRPVEVKHRHSAARTVNRGAEVDDGSAIYCHQCGRRANPGDGFCRTCGAKLRS